MSEPATLAPEVLARIKLGFFEECEEMLSELEAGLLALKRGETDPEIINTVFRAAHSIKGGGASFGLDSMVHFAHRMESVLAAIRSNQLALDAQLLGLLLRAADVLADHVRAARDGSQMEAAAARDIETALSAAVPHETATRRGRGVFVRGGARTSLDHKISSACEPLCQRQRAIVSAARAAISGTDPCDSGR